MIAPALPSRPRDDRRSGDADLPPGGDQTQGGKLGFIQQTIADHPTWALAAAGAVGLTLGWLVKRQRR
ncbi:hypothetical protein Mal15_68780 [Stieleria maiorica]|uniref:Uncharacterized protein n=1 Tax=Stieleria maiorica TaxID=2795974 RepID=A0A5B9MRQ0_9BACT|nr:hypothetical protein [Stieleria maiorica]QEG02757.1 hypothetical protein Mal15_68780 [Stieleria maiorica]